MPGVKIQYTVDPNRPGEPRPAGLGWLPNRSRHLLVSFVGEFVGTFLFLFFAFAGTQVANNLRNLWGTRHMNIASLLYISLAFGFSLAVNVWVFFRISGGLFNPAASTVLSGHGSAAYLHCLGHDRPGAHRSSRLDQGFVAHCRAIAGCHSRGCNRLWTSSRAIGRQHDPQPRDVSYAGPVHRDVLHFYASPYHLHAGSREAQGNIRRTNRHWTCTLHRRAWWCILHWRLTESRSFFWSCRCHGCMAGPSLDLLGWASSRCLAGSRLLQIDEATRLRYRKPGCRQRWP